MLSIVLSPRNVYFLISFLFDHISFDATVEATFMCSCAFSTKQSRKNRKWLLLDKYQTHSESRFRVELQKKEKNLTNKTSELYTEKEKKFF